MRADVKMALVSVALCARKNNGHDCFPLIAMQGIAK